MTEAAVQIVINGRSVSKRIEPRTHLADFIREEALATGTHIGCEQGVCGACTVFVDGRPIRACITLAVACDSSEVRTVEGFDGDPLMNRIRDAFQRHHGLQCGYCTPGMLATAYDIARRLPDAERAQIRNEISGNLCRCTGYAGIVAAIEDVLRNGPPAALVQPVARTRPRSSLSTASSVADPGIASGHEAFSVQDIPNADSFDDAVMLQQTLPLNVAAREAWMVLSDPVSVVKCVPGAEFDGPADGPLLKGRCTVMVGPIRAAFRGMASVDFDHAAMTGTLVGKGRDGLSRSGLEGKLYFVLKEVGPHSSVLDLDMRYRLNGPLSQFGRPALVREIADRLLSEVGTALEARVKAPGSTTPPRRPVSGLRLLVRALMKLFGRGRVGH